MARTDDDSFSYAASSWMSARISGTSDLLGKHYWFGGRGAGKRSDLDRWNGGKGRDLIWIGGMGGKTGAYNLPASVANRIVGEEDVMISESVFSFVPYLTSMGIERKCFVVFVDWYI